MDFTYEMFIPANLFESASKKNKYESLSERIVKAILINVLKISENEIVRGNPNLFEPDYVYKSQGYEVTLAHADEKIKQMKGIAPINSGVDKQEETLIKEIENAIKRKAEKKYSVKTTLTVFNLFPDTFWETDFIKPKYYRLENIQDHILADLWNTKRNDFFNKIFKNYISNGLFDDIFIISLTCNNRYILYSINNFYKNKNYKTYLGLNNLYLPHCELVSADYGEPFSPITNHYKINFGVLKNNNAS